MNRVTGKFLVILLIAGAIALYFALGLHRHLTPAYFRSLYAEHPLQTAAIFFAVYVLSTGLSLPGAAVLTVIGGMIFGLLEGALLVSFASSIGATLAFLVARLLLRDWVQRRFASSLEKVNRGIVRDGAFYLFGLRLIPVFPFWIINLVMGLTPMRASTFYLVSQIGMLPATIVYVNAGVQLGAVEEFSLRGILTPALVASFTLLAVFPLLARVIVDRVKHNRIYAALKRKGFERPSRYDANMLVIGAGSAGLVAAYMAAAAKAKVTLIEKDRMGGDCLNTGCVPSKALIRAARAVHQIRNARRLGIETSDPRIDFGRVMHRVRAVIGEIAEHDSVERYSDLGVDCVSGTARLVTPWEADVGGRRISARSIVIATGARPFVPQVPGLDEMGYLTSDNLWQLDELPGRLLVMGAGPVGCELAQAFQRLGSQAILVDMMPRILPLEDEDVSRFVQLRFEDEGIRVLVNHRATGFEMREGRKIAQLEFSGEIVELECDRVLVAVGRKADTDGLGLEEIGVDLTAQGTVAVDDYLRTRVPHILACGDVAGPYQFTHTAAHQAWYAAVNGLFGGLKKFRADYSVIPWATFTDPEVARVGLSESDARRQGIDYEVSCFGLDELDRAIIDDEDEGFVKVLTAQGEDRILGAVIVGYHASDLITEFITAMKRGFGLGRILGTIHIYPSVSEANKYVAGVWRNEHLPQRLLGWMEKYHNWMLK